VIKFHNFAIKPKQKARDLDFLMYLDPKSSMNFLMIYTDGNSAIFVDSQDSLKYESGPCTFSFTRVSFASSTPFIRDLKSVLVLACPKKTYVIDSNKDKVLYTMEGPSDRVLVKAANDGFMVSTWREAVVNQTKFVFSKERDVIMIYHFGPQKDYPLV
jgi:hypothetical protein